MPRQLVLPHYYGVLVAIVGINDFSCTLHFDAVFHNLHAVVGRERVSELPAHNESSVYINDGVFVNEAVFWGAADDVLF